MPTRRDDERVLEMLRLNAVDGLTAAEIATRLGVSKGMVCGARHRVMCDDMLASGLSVRWAYDRGRAEVGEGAIWP